MVKYICDICGKEIDISNPHNYSKYKLKNYTFGWDTWFWKKLIVHSSCWRSMCDFIKNSQSKESEHNPNAK